MATVGWWFAEAAVAIFAMYLTKNPWWSMLMVPMWFTEIKRDRDQTKK